ncbi:MAG: excinuclease ABC subunit UvrC, partial [Lachnospiraceae bacterium]|nr:excinuclease ABC subunit UvrC [Lachnospiraceae bacterium]
LFSYRKYDDDCKYFGPYKSKLSVNYVLEFVKKNYKIRTCNKNEKTFISDNTDKTRSKLRKECLYYHIGMCLAPCIRDDVKNEYDDNIKEVTKLLSGNIKPVIDGLKEKMLKLSNEEKFEECMDIRDKIYSIEDISTKQKIDAKTDTNTDVIGIYKEGNVALIQVFEIREGKIVDRFVNILNIDKEDEDIDIILSFIKQYYNETYFLPSEIVLPCDIGEEKALIEKWLNRDNRKKVLLTENGGTDKKGLVKLANMNAKIQFAERVAKYKKDEKDIIEAKDTLKKITGLDVCERFESFDISNTQGAYNVASLVVYDGFNFKKNDYRKFRIKSFEGADDYGAMREVIERRISHAVEKKEKKYWRLPDIFLIDGGLGQVNVVLEVLKKYDIDVPVMGMVKDDNHRTRGLVYQDMEIDLHDYKELFKLITKIQDETHRFAIEYHKSLRSKAQTTWKRSPR